MGIYDREYYRRDGPNYLESLIPSGQVCKTLIIVNIVVFVVQMMTRPVAAGFGLGPRGLGIFTEALVLEPNAVMGGQIWRLLSYAFLHDPRVWQHIVFNMLFLWWFGSDLEQLYGSREFLAFYLVSAVVGGLGFTAFQLAEGGHAQCLGASGAVTAVMVLYALHFPHRVILVFFILPVPIWLFVVFQIAQDSFIFVSGRETTTAVTVHLAGAAFGFLYHKLGWRLTTWWSGIHFGRKDRLRPRLRVYRPEDEAEPVPVAGPAEDLDEHLEAKLDAVLEKVARNGQASLTDPEKQILLRASEIYKRRRS